MSHGLSEGRLRHTFTIVNDCDVPVLPDSELDVHPSRGCRDAVVDDVGQRGDSILERGLGVGGALRDLVRLRCTIRIFVLPGEDAAVLVDGVDQGGDGDLHVAEVGRETGLGKRTVYRVFPTKDMLVGAYLQRRSTLLLGLIDADKFCVRFYKAFVKDAAGKNAIVIILDRFEVERRDPRLFSNISNGKPPLFTGFPKFFP